MPAEPRPALRRLVLRHGILPRYWDISGREHPLTDATAEALVGAMGSAAATERDAEAALASLDAQDADRLLPCSRIARPSTARHVAVRAGGRREIAWTMSLRLEDGSLRETRGSGRPHGGVLRMRWPGPLPMGYHHLSVEVGDGGTSRRGEQHLVVTPGACPRPAQWLGRRRRAFGIWSNLYAVRGSRDGGIGGVRELEELALAAAARGAAFVGVNPLHAIDHGSGEISPYRPSSRLFGSPLYLDPYRVPEASLHGAGRHLLREGAPGRELAALGPRPRVPYGELDALMGELIGALHRDATTLAPRERREEATPPLLSLFATFVALQGAMRRQGRSGHWRDWPRELRDPGSPAVAAWAAAHPEEVGAVAFGQAELSRQLDDVARTARRAGLRLGIYQDLALGSAPDGFDSWAFQETFVPGASLGAPPDPFAAGGQDWAIPPLHPSRLASDGYRYWRELLAANLRHAGILRIDHVMGVLRQFWIPAGRPASEGAYVAFPAADLLGILALESTRAGCLVVGEDLGTVPEGFSQLMARWGLLSSRVLYFEREHDGTLRPPRRYPRRALATLNTHDLPPLAGYWRGTDLELRAKADGADSPDASAGAREQRLRDVHGILRGLRRAGIPAPDPGGLPPRRELHELLSRTRSVFVGVSLDDLGGEEEPVNLPGVPTSRHPSWSRRMTRTISEIFDASSADLEALGPRRIAPRPARRDA